MTTAFIAEEYPDGFQGVTLPEPMLRRVAAAAAAMHRVAEIRRARISGRMDNHARKVGADWVVPLQDVVPGDDRRRPDRRHRRPSPTGRGCASLSDWTPGQPLARLEVDGEPWSLKVGRITSGYRVRVRGADLKVTVLSPRTAELAALMPEKAAARYLEVPALPDAGAGRADRRRRGRRGVRRAGALHGRGDEDGERAPRRAQGAVARVRAKPGDSLAVDDVILEFE